MAKTEILDTGPGIGMPPIRLDLEFSTLVIVQFLTKSIGLSRYGFVTDPAFSGRGELVRNVLFGPLTLFKQWQSYSI